MLDVARASSPSKAIARLDAILKRFHAILPTDAFVRIFSLPGHVIRRRKRACEVEGQAMRLDRFARTRSLPNLTGLRPVERQIVREYWTELRRSYARNPRVRRMREIIMSHSDSLPTSVIGEMFGVTGGAVLAHQRDLGVQNRKDAADQILREFLHALEPPCLEGLNDDERTALDRIWEAMRERSGVNQREREAELLRCLNTRVPTVVLGLFFGIVPSAVTARRRELNVPRVRADALLRNLLANPQAPQIGELTGTEQRKLDSCWSVARKARRLAREERLDELERSMVRRLGARKNELSGAVLVKCKARGCKFKWPRTSDFFQCNHRKPDGLEDICKVCVARRRRNPAKMKRAKPRLVRGAERRHIGSVAKRNAAILPSRFLLRLFDINRNHLMYIREEVNVVVSTAQSWNLYLRWVLADEMPAVGGLTGDELLRLISIWTEEKAAYAASLLEDDGKLGLQRDERRALLDRKPATVLVACHGPLCKGAETWPQTGQFFRRHTRCKPEDRLCLACANAVNRVARAEERKRKV